MSDTPNPSSTQSLPNQTGATAPAPARVVAPGTAASAPSGSASQIDENLWGQIMNEWVTNNLRNSATAQNTEGWNHLMTQLAALRKIVEKHIRL